MGTDGVEEDQLQEDVAFDEVQSGFVGVAVEQVEVLYAGEVMQALLYDIAVYHLFVCLSYLQDLVLDLVLEYCVEVLHVGIFRLPRAVLGPVLQRLGQKHLEGGELHDGCIGVFFCEIGVVDGVAGLRAGHPRGVSAVFLHGLF